MPDNERLLFGAEFSGQGFAAGAESVVTSLTKIKKANEELREKNEALKASTEKLQKANSEIAKDYSAVSTSIQKVESQLSKLNTTTFQGEAAATRLKKQLAEMKNDQAAFAKAMQQNSTQVENFGKQLSENNKVIGTNTGLMTQLGKSAESISSASEKATFGVGKLYGGLRTLANILPGIGIGGLIGLLYELGAAGVTALIGLNSALSETEKNMNTLAAIQGAANSEFAGGYGKLELLRAKLVDLNIPEKERLVALREYNKIADQNNKIDETQINNADKISRAITSQIELIKERAVARGGENIIADRSEKLFKAQEEARLKSMKARAEEEKVILKDIDEHRTLVNNNALVNNGKFFEKLDVQARERGKVLSDVANDPDVVKAQEELNRALGIGISLTTIPGLTTEDTKTKKAKKEIENVFLQRLADLRARLAAAMDKDFQSNGLIREKFAAQMDKEFQEIATLLKEKKLTGPQADILRGLVRQINQVDLSTALTEFHKKQKDAIDKIDEEIVGASLDAARKRIDNIRNEFDKEKAVIAQSYAGTVSGLNKQLRTLVTQIQEDVNKGLITPAAGQRKAFILEAIFGDLITQAGVDRTNRELDLAFKTFQRTIQDFKTQLQTDTTGFSEEVSDAIRKQADYFLSGQISYDHYQKNITKILRDEQRLRKFLLLSELKDELTAINSQIAQTTDPGLLDKLKAQQVGVREQIANVNREIAQGDAGDKEGAAKKRISNFEAYAHAIEGVLQNVVSFWSQVNAVEAASLDRSIALQQKRVDSARDIAEKGNAEYLEMEQKRLDELERKREENARRQMVLNQALTVSQALVATVSAIAQAVSTGSPIAAIAAVGAVIGAIAAGYAFVKSLQPVSANFYEGSEYVEGRGRPRGKDTVPANLTIGERVVPADRNAEYWDALHAIHNRLIPPDILNDFVNKYPNVNFERLEMATGIKLGFDSLEISSRLEKLNGTMEEVVAAVSGLGFNVNMDQSGFSAALSKYQKAERLKKLS